jgi:hypothetical protein
MARVVLHVYAPSHQLRPPGPEVAVMKFNIARTSQKSEIELRCDALVDDLTKKKIFIEPIPHSELYSHTRPDGKGMPMVALSRLQNPDKFVAVTPRAPSTPNARVQPKMASQNR